MHQIPVVITASAALHRLFLCHSVCLLSIALHAQNVWNERLKTMANNQSEHDSSDQEQQKNGWKNNDELIQEYVYMKGISNYTMWILATKLVKMELDAGLSVLFIHIHR